MRWCKIHIGAVRKQMPVAREAGRVQKERCRILLRYKISRSCLGFRRCRYANTATHNMPSGVTLTANSSGIPALHGQLGRAQ
jgi:hypothetical protein